MKFLICAFIGILAVISVAQADVKDEIIALAKKCQEEVHTTPEEMQKFFKGGMNAADATPNIKCQLKCVMENRGFFTNGEFDVKAFIEKMQNFGPIKDHLDAVIKIASDCKGEKGEDACETAFKIAMCLKEKTNEQGIKCNEWV